MKAILLGLIRGYQAAISPMLGVACRYEPSCSRYAHEAIERHGARRGLKLTASRLARCRPGGGEGYDPVPDTRQPSHSHRTHSQERTATNHLPKKHASDAVTAHAAPRVIDTSGR